MLKKNDVITVKIIDMGSSFEGIAKLEDGFVIFVPQGVIGEKVEVKIIKVNKNFAYGKILNILEKSSDRIDNIECKSYKYCGGCDSWHFSNNLEKKLKRNNIVSLLKKQGIDINIDETLFVDKLFYRNKVQYPVRNIAGINKFGFFTKRSHNITCIDKCYIQNEEIDVLAKKVYEKLINEFNFIGYNEENLSGDIRHIILRRSSYNGNIMVIIVVNKSKLLKDNRFKEISKLDENIKSVVINLNDKNTNEILGDESNCIFGNEYIIDVIGNKKYYISAKSFFQINTYVTEVLYSTLKENLNLNKEDILFDLYSGVGSIGIYLAESVKNVYGIEIEKEAVKMANMNLSLNNINNAEYIEGSVENKIIEFEKRNIKPSVIVVDPPRAGLDEKSIEYILNFNANKIGYVSCNPATLARDLKKLEAKYIIEKVVPVDMFPKTRHVECVSVLHRKSLEK